MRFDLKVPIGLLFSIYGILLTLDGVVGGDASIGRWRGLNVNLVWGLLMLVFGIMVLSLNYWLRRRGGRR